MRDSITYYVITLSQPWTPTAPGAREQAAGTLLYIGEGMPPLGGSRAGWTSEGWYIVTGHGQGETIPVSHLSLKKHRFERVNEVDMTWASFDPQLPRVSEA